MMVTPTPGFKILFIIVAKKKKKTILKDIVLIENLKILHNYNIFKQALWLYIYFIYKKF